MRGKLLEKEYVPGERHFVGRKILTIGQRECYYKTTMFMKRRKYNYMNIQEYDVMNAIIDKGYHNQRTLSESTGYSLGKVNQSLAALVKDGYLNKEYTLTDRAVEEIQQKKPKNAIILAAGYGVRMVPINREIPKGLIEVGGEPLIERLIRQLHEAGIHKIDIVVGFMKEQYEYLIDQYGVNLIVNREYGDKNNLHSLKLAADRISNTYIIPCDVWCSFNPFSDRELYSWYMVTDLVDDESDVRVNRKLELVAVDAEKSGNGMIGIAYILERDAERLRTRIRELTGRKSFNNAFWEAALMDREKMTVSARVVPAREVYEINTYEQLRELDEESKQLNSGILQEIAGALDCEVKEIEQIEVLKKGMTNRSFRFSCRGRSYIMRIPGEGTEQLINRRQEYEVYQVIKDLKLSDTIRYFDPDSGCKLTEYLEGARCCDSENPEDVKKCMKVLRKFHSSGLKAGHTFDIFERIEFYESLWKGEPSCYRDYDRTKEKVYELKKYIDEQPKNWILCHIDSVPDNFLMQGEGENEKISLIDWEYAGMQDEDVDIAMFAIYALYEKDKVDELIDAYYTEGCREEVRLKIYAYIAVCGFLWSNWCEFKRHEGVEFGEYSLRQYGYAKEYYRYVKQGLEGEQ